jgi:hypothetical protein
MSACGATLARAAKRDKDDAEAGDVAVASATKQRCERSEAAARPRQLMTAARGRLRSEHMSDDGGGLFREAGPPPSLLPCGPAATWWPKAEAVSAGGGASDQLAFCMSRGRAARRRRAGARGEPEIRAAGRGDGARNLQNAELSEALGDRRPDAR